jgi:predicted O-methyltransferase YrrM
MPSSLSSPTVVAVLERLHAQAHAEDEPVKARVRAREAELGERLDQARRYEIYGGAPLAIKRKVGELLYLLIVGRRARTVVEFGASLGLSTIYLAAALRDCGGARLITTELLASKAEVARQNIVDAGLDDLVELRVGDALETLRDLAQEVDVLFLDGRNDLYVQVLDTVAPHLAPAALIVADLSADDPDLPAYLAHVRDPSSGYLSVQVPLDEGVELCVRVPR